MSQILSINYMATEVSDHALQLPPPKEMDFSSSNVSDSWTTFKKSFGTYSSAIELSGKDQAAED